MSNEQIIAARAMITPAKSGRSSTIDAFRGLAAFCVVVQHLLLSWPDQIVQTLHSALYYTPLEALFSDGKFIRIFFVISGFVMFLPLAKPGKFNWSQFYVRRFWRIYPAFVASVLIALAVDLFLPQPLVLPNATAWFNHEAQPADINWRVLFEVLAFAGTPDSLKINCVTWSLVLEARVILVFPLLAFGVLRSGSLTLVLVGLASVIATAVYPMVGETGYFISARTPLGALCSTLHFLPLFVIGMVLAQRLEFFIDLIGCLKRPARIVLWVAAFVLIRRSQEYIAGPGSALLILMCLRSGLASRALSIAPLQWLGKISYSLYLLHIPVLVLILHVFDGVFAMPTNLLIALGMSLVVSHMFEVVFVPLFAVKRPSAPATTGVVSMGWRAGSPSAAVPG
jgi:peptidoglycan/LPS O-acetylase OafA/YrhL